ncbi:glycosyltransferase family 2 protein [Cobetia sp. D5]|uniref:glycosyltransferase family 2 protein n=1 Tax=Cobetia sp. D5 TaxID=3105867 RepID=UPI002D79AAFB|nr:glycosyltransferase family 2 protein [Cobetia sp. D5]
MGKVTYRVCAIAKDEAPYLAEWVFHHHYFGFESIVVYINRTTDSSVEVLKALQQYVPGLEYEIVDWVDYCGPEIGGKIQVISYAKDIARCKDLNVDYWMPLDIDEFWTPSDFSTNIDNHVRSITEGQEAISYPWYCEIGYSEPFAIFTPSSRFHFGSHVKTLCPRPWESIRRVRIHRPVFYNLTVVDPSGDQAIFQKERPQLLEKSSIKKRSAYIIHRMNRSEVEYFALLKKGQPKSKDDLKTNRSGYKGVENPSRRRFSWPEDSYNKYMNARQEFYNNTGVESLVVKDKQEMLSKSNYVVEKLKSMSSGDPEALDIASKLLSGTSHAIS